MPLVTINVFKDELSNSQAKDLIRKVTEAVIPFVGEKRDLWHPRTPAGNRSRSLQSTGW